MTLFQSISKPVGAMPRMAILPPLFIVSIMSRKAGAAARHFEPDIEALVHAELRITSPSFSFEASTTCMDAELRGRGQRTGLMSVMTTLRAPDALRDQRAHDADRAGAGDQHVLADQIEGQRGVHGIAERVEDRGDLVGHVVGDRHDIVLRDRQIFAEGARPVDADAERVAAEMPAAGAAVAAMAADDMAFARDALADLVFGDGRAEIGDRADEFMAGDHRHRHGLLRPLVPIVDMHVGAADRGLPAP